MIPRHLKVLVIVDSYPPHHLGGYELRCKDIVEGMQKRGHEILVLTTRCPQPCRERHDDQEYTRRILHKKSISKSAYQRVLREWIDAGIVALDIRRFSPDLIALYHIGDLSNEILPLIHNIGKPTILDDGGLASIHAIKILRKKFPVNIIDANRYSNWTRPITLLSRAILSYLATGTIELKNIESPNWPSNLHVCFNSRYSFEYACSRGVPQAKGRIIYSGIDESTFSFREKPSPALSVHIITPGRICPEKGTIDSVLLAEELDRRGIRTTLTIIGPQDQDKEYATQIQQAIQSNDLAGCIKLFPIVSQQELIEHYHVANICFFPSRQRVGFSRVPLEAMATGCIVLTYGHESSREIIDSWKTGIIIPEGDIVGAADAVQRLINEPAIYSAIVHSARKMIEKHFTMQRYIDEIEEYWCSIVTEAKKGHEARKLVTCENVSSAGKE